MLVVLAVIAFLLRYNAHFIQLVSPDMKGFVREWIRIIHNGGLAVYGEMFADYAPLYTYFLGVVALLPESLWLVAAKTISIAGDVALAAAVGATVHYSFPILHNKQVQDADFSTIRRNVTLAGAAAVLCFPTVWINSAMWGQCDVLWTCCCVLSLLFFIKERPVAGMIWFGVAFAFKQQAIFFSPVILVLLLAGKARWWQTLLVPAVYLATCLPCVLMGRSWASMLNVYVHQGVSTTYWYNYAPNLYIFLRDEPINGTATLIIMFILVAVTIFICRRLAERFRGLDRKGQLSLILIFSAFCAGFYPFALPGMHERYFYLCDITALIAACSLLTDWKMWLSAVAMECGSAVAVYMVLSWRRDNDLYMAVGVLFAIVAIATLAVRLWPQKSEIVNLKN